MRIVHIDLIDQYNESWSYQDNILPRMHKQAGHEVTMITTCKVFNASGGIEKVAPDCRILSDGVKLIRVEMSKRIPLKKVQALLTPYDIFELLKQIMPDLIMVHGMTAKYANKDVLRYIKRVNPKCALVIDSHTCEINAIAHSAKGIKTQLILQLENAMRRQLYPYCKRVFAITPACGKYAVKYYAAPAEKVELLPLGYDPTVLPWEKREEARQAFRKQHHLRDDDIVIIHGGKIIRRRKTPETIEAVARIEDPRVKLVVFGGVDAEMKREVEAALKKYPEKVLYLGHLTPEEYHQAYYGADIALFPGGQSVLWQQAIGCGLPLVVGNDKDLDYLNRGGNTEFIDDTSVEGIYQKMIQIMSAEKYAHMKKMALGEAREFFSYERIAKQVTDCVE